MTEFAPDFRPRLRDAVKAVEVEEPGRVAFVDASRLIPGGVVLPLAVLPVVERFTGALTLAELAAAMPGVSLPVMAQIAAALDGALLLETRTFTDYVFGRERRPCCVGVYPGDPAGVAGAVDRLFTAPGGPGLATAASETDAPRLRALLVPHMDYARGNVTYGWGYHGLAARTRAEVFVVVATSHHSGHRFTLTRKDFTTPLGTVPTDQAAVELLEREYGDGLFDDMAAHLPEHSIELEVVILQHLLRGRPFRVVPLLVGSFHDCTRDGVSPAARPDIARMVAALRKLDASLGARGCFVISGDLAHIGPKFGDAGPVTPEQLGACEAQDSRLLATFARPDPDAYAEVIRAEQDARHVCGFAPTWLTLAALRPARGRTLHYQQYVDPAGHESVSFAAAAFEDSPTA